MRDLNEWTSRALARVGEGILSLPTLSRTAALGHTLASFATGMAYRVRGGLPW